MSLYSASNNVSAAPATNTPAIDLLAAAPVSCRLFELAVVNNGAAQFWGLGRPGNDGSVVQTTTVAPQADNPADPPAVSRLGTAWSTAPTVPNVMLRRMGTPTSQGQMVIWTFTRGLLLKPSFGVVLWNTGSSNINQITNWILEE